VALDLVFTPPANSPLALVAWEAHLKLQGGGAADLMPAPGSSSPVQEQGGPPLALDGLTPLAAASAAEGSGAVAAQYFTVQNRYEEGPGRLDYAVTLLGFKAEQPPLKPGPALQPGGFHLGRITLAGKGKGSAELLASESSVPFQAVGLAASGALEPMPTAGLPQPLARLRVDPDQPPAELRGLMAPSAAGEGALPGAAALSVSFWAPGAEPPWRGGAAQPVAVFDQVPADSQGAFRVSDVAPQVLPAGSYHVRVKAPGSLSQKALEVWAAPAAGAAAPRLSFGPLRYGDANGDDGVDAADLALVQAAFGRQAGDPGYLTPADFAADQVVDGQDFSRMAASFHQVGD
jgi:hypothetical protein